MSTVFVTGGTGFIGSHTVEHLLQSGHHVRCLIRPGQTQLRWLHGLPVELAEGDLQDSKSLLRLVEDVDYIIHIAGVTKAKRKSEYFTGNVAATEQLLHAACLNPHLKKFCYVGSLTAVGPSPTGVPLTETAPCHPITSYGQSKLEAEHVCKRFQDKLPMVIIRPPAVFGPRDPDILEMFKFVTYGLKPVIGSSKKTLSLVYAPDLAKGIAEAAFNERTTGETYNIADSHIVLFSEVIDTLAVLAQKKAIRFYLPKGLIYTIAGITQFVSLFLNKPAVLNIEKARDLLQTHWVCDPRKIQNHVGFRTPTPLPEALERTFRWYKEMKWL